MAERLKAPFPWFGGKSRAAGLIWEGLGDVRNFVEPFFGSGAVLLGRPTEPRIETVNDADCYLANFWRAVTAGPEAVAAAADWPVNEADLHARHRWLVDQAAFRDRMRTDPDYFDAKVAGWWAWGLSCWIGGGWCNVESVERYAGARPDAAGDRRGMGVHKKRPKTAGDSGGGGVHSLSQRKPNVDGRGQKGLHQRRPNMGGQAGGQGVQSPSVVREEDGLIDWFCELAERFRRVRVCCGDWARVLTPAVLMSHGGPTGVVLDPPYDQDLRADNCYAVDAPGISSAVRAWALENGSNPDLRIVLCGYEGEHEMPSSWRVAEWTALGGYSRAERGKANKERERLWFSPACLSATQASLFDGGPA